MTEVLTQPSLMPSMSNSPPMDHSPPTSSQPRPYASQTHMPYTPPSSGDSPESYSPISPRAQWNVPAHLRAHSRQLRPPKSPMYVPAVLRPTEKPIKQSPPKGNRLSCGTIDGGFDIDGPVGMGDGIVPGLSRIVTEEWNEEVLGQVTGAPSRNHWKVCSFSLLVLPSVPHSAKSFLVQLGFLRPPSSLRAQAVAKPPSNAHSRVLRRKSRVRFRTTLRAVAATRDL